MQIESTNFNRESLVENTSVSNKKDAWIYVGFVSTPGLFASIIRKVIGQKYVHVVLGLDEKLEEAYSVGRRNPAIPLLAGFEQEEKAKILKVYPNAEYRISRISCTQEQKLYIKESLHQCMEQRMQYHYTVLGLPFILFNKPFYQENHYTCSSYLARLLQSAEVVEFTKHFSLVTPRDFMEYPDQEVIFEGMLESLVPSGAVPVETYYRADSGRRPYGKKGYMGSNYANTGVI